MFRTTVLLALSLVLICSTPSLIAQQSASLGSVVPSMVKFNGIVNDVSGKPLAGTVGVTFLLYKDQTGGMPLWMETQNVQADRNGHYSVMLGSATSHGLPAEAFAIGEARWLGIQPSGQAEQPRVVLASVPYALKAADAETLGGRPASAYILAAPIASGAQSSTNPAVADGVGASPATAVTTTGGTVNALPLWTTGSNIQSSALTQTGTGATAKIGIGTTAPATTLDVKGAATVRGALTLPATAAATAVAGANSQPENQVASSFSSSTKAAVNQTFQWLAEPAANNTSAPSGTLNLRYGLGTATPSETGLKLNSKGIFTFAPGQTFPGTGGTVTSVGLSAPSSDFTVTGSPVTKSGTLGLQWTVAPSSANAGNAIVKRDPAGNFSASKITAFAMTANTVGNNGIAFFGTTTNGDGVAGMDAGNGNGVYGSSVSGYGVYGGSNTADGVHGVSNSSASGVAGINTAANGTGVYGAAPGWSFTANGNTNQDRTSGGWVKAMVFASPNGIAYCFNSTLAGAAATTPPCGFNYTKFAAGDYNIDFGFQVDDRFFATGGGGGVNIVCTDNTAVPGCPGNVFSQNQIELIWTQFYGGPLLDTKYYLTVY